MFILWMVVLYCLIVYTFQDNQLVEIFVFKMNGLTEEALRYVYYNYSSYIPLQPLSLGSKIIAL